MNRSDEICLWSVVGQDDPALLERTLRVLRYCNSLAPWRQKILFTVLDPMQFPRVEGLRIQQIPAMTEWKQWSVLVGKIISMMLAGFPYSLCVHDDGFPIDVSRWHPDFLSYDYIGAPWPHSGLVGSGGCSLASNKFAVAVNQLPWYDGAVNFDEWVCRVHRPRMLELGVRFAPPEVAVKFCTESDPDNDQPSFAFHGRKHSPDKYAQGWRQIEDWERQTGWLK